MKNFDRSQGSATDKPKSTIKHYGSGLLLRGLYFGFRHCLHPIRSFQEHFGHPRSRPRLSTSFFISSLCAMTFRPLFGNSELSTWAFFLVSAADSVLPFRFFFSFLFGAPVGSSFARLHLVFFLAFNKASFDELFLFLARFLRAPWDSSFPFFFIFFLFSSSAKLAASPA